MSSWKFAFLTQLLQLIMPILQFKIIGNVFVFYFNSNYPSLVSGSDVESLQQPAHEQTEREVAEEKARREQIAREREERLRQRLLRRELHGDGSYGKKWNKNKII